MLTIGQKGHCKSLNGFFPELKRRHVVRVDQDDAQARGPGRSSALAFAARADALLVAPGDSSGGLRLPTQGGPLCAGYSRPEEFKRFLPETGADHRWCE